MTGTVTHPARDKRMLVVFSGPRAGSNLLADILGQLPDVLALSEVFNPAGIYGLSLHPDLETELTERAGGPRALARLFRMNPPGALALLDAAVPQDQAIVLKVLPHHVHLAALRECLEAQAFGVDDPRRSGASGVEFLDETASRVRAAGFEIANVAVQVIGNQPRVGSRRDEAQQVLGQAIGAPVSVSGTTTDGLGLTGRGEGVAAIATALLTLT